MLEFQNILDDLNFVWIESPREFFYQMEVSFRHKCDRFCSIA